MRPRYDWQQQHHRWLCAAFAGAGSEMMAISAQQTKTHVAIAAWEWPVF